MVISGGGEDLVFVGRDRGVVGDEFGYDIISGFNVESKRVDIYENDFFSIFFIGKNISLDSSVESDGFIGVDVFGSFFVIKEFFNEGLDFGDMGRIINKNDVIDFVFGNFGVFENLFYRFESFVEEVVVEFFEFGVGKGFREVFVVEKGFDFNMGGYLVGKGMFGFFGFMFEFIYGFGVSGDINIVFFVEGFGEVVNDMLVEIFIIKMSIIGSS